MGNWVQRCRNTSPLEAEQSKRRDAERTPFSIMPQQLSLAETVLQLSIHLRAAEITHAEYQTDLAALTRFLDPAWAPSVGTMLQIQQQAMVPATHEPCRLHTGSAAPEEETTVMLRLLQRHLPNLDAWVDEAARKGLGKNPVMRLVYANEDELHNNFRSLCKFGEAVLVKQICAQAAWFTNKSSAKFNESGLTLAAKYGQQAVVVELLRASADVGHEANGGTALTWTCRSFSKQNFNQREAELAGTAFLLMQAGANVNGTYSLAQRRYKTPLGFAVERDSEALVALLVAGGGRVLTQADDLADDIAEQRFREIVNRRHDREVEVRAKLVRRSVALWLCLQKRSSLPEALIEQITEWVWAEEGHGARFKHRT